jgi:cytochrome c-type biogenesis protein CcmH/NrfG
VTHAHSYVIETFADFGLIGIAVSLALLVAWGMAVRRTLGGLSPPRSGAAQDPISGEWNGMVTMVVVAVIFGVSSLIDWTWFIPGVAVPAFVCAGWVAARGSLADPVPARARARGRLPLGRVAAATAALATALIVGWFVWQPLHSSDQVSAAITAMTRGDTSAAIAAAKGAADSDPVSVDPVWELGAIYSAIGQKAASRAEYVKATQIQPSNPATWQQLGSVDLQANRRHLAVGELYAALRLFPASLLLKQLIGLALFGPPSGSHARTGSA